MENRKEAPFYLMKPSRSSFVATPETPRRLEQQLSVFERDLKKELSYKYLPQRKKEESLEYFLGGKHDMREILADFELSQRTLNNSKDDCTLGSSLKKMRGCHVSKNLVPLDAVQLRSFHLQATPDVPVFSSELKAEIDLKYKRSKIEERKLWKKEKRQRKVPETLSGSSQDSLPLSQDDKTDGSKPVANQGAVDLVQTQQLEATSHVNKPACNAAVKKSVAAALKDIRGLGRGRGRPPGCFKKTGLHQHKPSRGRGRPRKTPKVEEEVADLLKPHVDETTKFITFTAPPALPAVVTPIQPVLPTTSNAVTTATSENATVKSFSGLKMTLKLGGAGGTSTLKEATSVPPPAETEEEYSATLDPDRLICRIRLNKPKETE